MTWNTGRFAQGTMSGGIGPGLLYGFYGQDPQEEANKYLDQIPGETHKNLDPWAQYGMGLTQHPGERMNEIGQSYQQSPGLQFAIQQALQGAGRAQAAGGMAGSPQHEQMNMGLATNLANQDYYKWMENALGLHNTGYGYGQQASTGINDQISQALAAKAGLGYAGAVNNNEAWGSSIDNMNKNVGALAAFLK